LILTDSQRTIAEMPASIDTVEKQALALSVDGRALLVEKLLASLAGEVNAEVESVTLGEVRKRRAAVAKGKSKLIDGKTALAQTRAALRQ
jgi:hypothetical protein